MRPLNNLKLGVAFLCLATSSTLLRASSHMDAPLITFDDPANTTDVYAFRSSNDGVEYLTTALAVYPFEEPGIGPNKYNFDDNVLYEIHVALGEVDSHLDCNRFSTWGCSGCQWHSRWYSLTTPHGPAKGLENRGFA